MIGTASKAGRTEDDRARPSVEESNPGLIPAFIVVVATVYRHVHVFQTMNQDPQGESPILDRLDDQSKLVDLVDHAADSRTRILWSYFGSSRGTST
jgi:hypothetical protein